MSIICAFTASSQPHSRRYEESLAYLGAQGAQRGHPLVMGGMANGCMGVYGQSHLQAGGSATIVTPVEYVAYEEGFTHENLLRETTPDTLTRLDQFIKKSDGFIAGLGGIGTIGEIGHMLADNQACLYHTGTLRKIKPLVIYNFENESSYLIRHYQHMHTLGYISAEHLKLLLVHTDDIDEVFPLLEQQIASANA